MKPGDHPDFFRLAPPPGASRQSTIRLDRHGQFWHDGGRIENAALAAAMHSWIALHPDDGKFILTNGYDWVYFEVEDAPFSVVSVVVGEESITMRLSDGSEESLRGEGMRVGDDGALYVRVKGGRFEAKFSRHAQVGLAPALGEKDGSVLIRVGAIEHQVGPLPT